MRIKLKHFLVGCFIALGLLIGLFTHLPDGKLHLVFCDVGQGDAIYIKTPRGSDILIDGGPNEKVLSCLSNHMPFYDREIELLILTHPHVDHLTGLVSVLDRYQVKKLILENIYVNNSVFEMFRQKVNQEKAEIFNPKEGDRIIIDGVELTALWPRKVLGDKDLWKANISGQMAKSGSAKENYQKVLGASTINSDLNETSLVFQVSFNDFKALLTGDAGNKVLSNISFLKSASGDFNVLKVPHHGSKTSLTTTLIDQLRPKTAVISVGKNSFGHPAEEILKILREKDIKILRTDKGKEVEITN